MAVKFNEIVALLFLAVSILETKLVDNSIKRKWLTKESVTVSYVTEPGHKLITPVIELPDMNVTDIPNQMIKHTSVSDTVGYTMQSKWLTSSYNKVTVATTEGNTSTSYQMLSQTSFQPTGTPSNKDNIQNQSNPVTADLCNGHPDCLVLSQESFWKLLRLLKNHTKNRSPFQYQYTEEQLSHNIWKYVSPLIIIGGTVGNGLSVAVMSRKSLRNSITSLYLTVLAFADTLVLYTGLLRHWIKASNDIDVRNFGEAGCRFHTFLVYWSTDFANWLIVIVTVERFISVHFPTKARRICTKVFAAVSIVTMAMVLLGINLHLFWTTTLSSWVKLDMNTGLHRITSCGTPIFDSGMNHFKLNIWPWIDFSFFSLIPFVIILTCNASIIFQLVITRRNRRNNLHASTPSNLRINSMTAILLTIAVVFFILTAPISIYLIMQVAWIPLSVSAHTKAKANMWWAIVNMLSYTNNAINFLLYCLSGTRFRKEVKLMFCKTKVHPAVQPRVISLVVPDTTHSTRA